MKDIKTREVKKDIKVLYRTRKSVDKMQSGYSHVKEEVKHDTDGNKPSEEAINHGHRSIKIAGKTIKNQTISSISRVKKQRNHYLSFKQMREVDKKYTSKKSNNTFPKATAKSIKNTKNKIKVSNSPMRYRFRNKPKNRSMGSHKVLHGRRKQKYEKIVTALKGRYKSVIHALRRMVTTSKLLLSSLIAGASVIVTIILVISLVGMIIASPLAIFFSNDGSSDSTMTLSEAISEINNEYIEKITIIKNDNPHDEVDISGARTNWKEVLAVYAVKTVTEKQIDVITIDDERKQLLKDIFFDMNELEYVVEEKEVQEGVVSDDGNGNLVEEVQTVTKKILKITTNGKSAQEMTEQYHFSDEQKEQLEEMLSTAYDDTWQELLYGVSIGTGNSNIVEIAKSQLGNIGGQPYWSWYGFTSRVEWCACFVSWCANQAGYIDAGIIPKFAGCQSQGIPWFQNRGLWQSRGYVPKPGDIIFFDWESNGHADHVGIVEYIEENIIHTIEGNSENECARREYTLNNKVIVGFGTPLYE
jgi:hypothetical protein